MKFPHYALSSYQSNFLALTFGSMSFRFLYFKLQDAECPKISMYKNGTLEEDSETEEDTEAEEKRVLKKVEQESQTYASTGYNMNYGQNNYGQQNYGNRGFGHGRQQIPGQNELNRRLKPEEEEEKLEKEIDEPDVSDKKKK